MPEMSPKTGTLSTKENTTMTTDLSSETTVRVYLAPTADTTWLQVDDWAQMAEGQNARLVDDSLDLIGVVSAAYSDGVFLVIPDEDGSSFHFAPRYRGTLFAEAG
jgi:hypothetical protein